jgi:hypothetical protein
MSRASTSWLQLSKIDVDGRAQASGSDAVLRTVKFGHDERCREVRKSPKMLAVFSVRLLERDSFRWLRFGIPNQVCSASACWNGSRYGWANPSSTDLRERRDVAVEIGALSYHQVAARFGTGLARVGWAGACVRPAQPGLMSGHKPKAIWTARSWLPGRTKAKDFAL